MNGDRHATPLHGTRGNQTRSRLNHNVSGAISVFLEAYWPARPPPGGGPYEHTSGQDLTAVPSRISQPHRRWPNPAFARYRLSPGTRRASRKREGAAGLGVCLASQKRKRAAGFSPRGHPKSREATWAIIGPRRLQARGSLLDCRNPFAASPEDEPRSVRRRRDGPRLWPPGPSPPAGARPP